MIKPLLYFLFFAPLLSFAQECELFEIRELYEKSVLSEAASESLVRDLTSCPKNNILEGYAAAAHMISAKHAWNPIRKSSLFFKGKHSLEATILRNFEEVELRFLRLTIQSSIPSFLGYKSSISSDKKYILANYFSIDDVDLKTRIKSFILNSGYFDQSEIKYIQY